MFDFSFHFSDTSIFWILFCMLLATAYSAVLYYLNYFYPKKIKITLTILRWVLVFIVSLFLFSPMFTRLSKRIEKPILIFAQDNSKSIVKNNRAAFYQKEYLQQLSDFKNKLSNKFDVKIMPFADGVSNNSNPDFTENKTNISSVFKEISSNYRNQNLAAVILASDGIANKGADPLYEMESFNAPVYTIRMGDSIPQKDIVIRNVLYNKIVYKGNQFSITAQIKSYDLAGNKAELSIIENGTLKSKKTFLVDKQNYFTQIPIVLDADKVGLQTYTLRINPLKGEKNLINNSSSVYIEVIDGKQKIALIANAPHPDLAAIKTSIESNQNYQVDIIYADQLNLDAIKNYQLAILHQLPSGDNQSASLFKQLELSRTPILFIIGAQTYLDMLNRYADGISIQGTRSNANEVFPIWNSDFYYFSLSDESKEILAQMPPLLAPYGYYEIKANLQTLAYQRIGSVPSSQPLISLGDNNGQKLGWIVGEGIWKWKLTNFKLNQNFNAVEELLSKSIQYLSTKEDKRKFRVRMESNEWNEGDEILFNAELYDNSYQLVNSPDVSIQIKNEKNKLFDFVFSKSGQNYGLNAGVLPSGNYSYVAKTKLGTDAHTFAGKFTVRAIQLEDINTTADFNLLRTIAAKTSAESFGDDELNLLADQLLLNENFKSITSDQKETDELIDINWLMILLILIISTEWFFRKYFGGY